MPAAIHLHQIANSAAARAQIPPGWLVLGNDDNLLPDWFEYWPMRRSLLAQALDEAAWYGFFSPNFCSKTQLGLADVQAYVRAREATTDVFLFSTQPDMGAFFLNVFEQGETFDPGLIDAYSALLDHSGQPAPFRQLGMDSRQTVFSNYFIAKPEFWQEWLKLNEAIFAACEAPTSPEEVALQAGLAQPTIYPGPGGPGGPVQRKVFLIERAASLILATQPAWLTLAHNPCGFGWSTSRFGEHPTEAFISDALKMASRDQRYPQFMQACMTVRDRFQRQARTAVEP